MTVFLVEEYHIPRWGKVFGTQLRMLSTLWSQDGFPPLTHNKGINMEKIISDEADCSTNATNIGRAANKNVFAHKDQFSIDHVDSQEDHEPLINAEGINIKQGKILSLNLPAATVDDAMKWVEQTDPDEIAGEWVNKVQLLDAAGQDAVKQAVSNKTLPRVHCCRKPTLLAQP